MRCLVRALVAGRLHCAVCSREQARQQLDRTFSCFLTASGGWTRWVRTHHVNAEIILCASCPLSSNKAVSWARHMTSLLLPHQNDE